ncbi:MAG: M28 family peptidase [Bacteroidales bacterium]|jgi:hypothetical protein|nr:M28 family peptidase [Bacteroidales bacterium]
MKKNLVLIFCFLFISLVSIAGKFIMIPVDETNSLNSLFDNKDICIHYYCDDFVLASTENYNSHEMIVLDQNAFKDLGLYAIVYCNNDMKDDYIVESAENARVLFSGEEFLIMKLLSEDFMPAKNDGMVMISSKMKASLPKSLFDFPTITEQDDDILNYINEVSIERMMTIVQRLQDFQTRYYRKDSSFAAQDWIMAQYEELDLEVFLHDFPLNGSSDNVIAIQRGTEFPDEYVVCGCHYDSYCYTYSHNIAPGADDNATGVAGILETARILNQYDFRRSIIYCSFSAEEVGLVGSSYYAEKCADEDMNIVGYFNLDMTGYLTNGSDIHIDLIYPNSAQILADYYTNICDVYLPDVPVKKGTLLNGNSDHTSFNNNGYLGIFPFEDANAYSPYIHSIADTIGLSVNNTEQMKIFTQANIASVATLAAYNSEIPSLPFAAPVNCLAEFSGEDYYIIISWDAPQENTPLGYNVYREGVKINQQIISGLLYFEAVTDNEEYCYQVKAIYHNNNESEFSNISCAFVPTGIDDMNVKPVIYPNPANDKIYINGDYLNQQVDIYDINGKLMNSIRINSNITEINISDLPKGLYLINISNKFIGKFVKN